MKPKIKPVKGYCIWSPNMGLLSWTFHIEAREAKSNVLDNDLFSESWEELYYNGYRCVRVVMSAEGTR